MLNRLKDAQHLVIFRVGRAITPVYLRGMSSKNLLIWWWKWKSLAKCGIARPTFGLAPWWWGLASPARPQIPLRRCAKLGRKGALLLGLVNVVGSTISRLTEAGVYNHGGPEIGVASTKFFTSQCCILAMIALLLGRFKHLSVTDGWKLSPGAALPAKFRWCSSRPIRSGPWLRPMPSTTIFSYRSQVRLSYGPRRGPET